MICVGCFSHFDQQVIREFPKLNNFPINKLQIPYLLWYLQLINWKIIQFWCYPGVRHLYPIFKPHCGGFVWTFSPTMGHLQLFQNKMTNVWQRPGGGGGGWACLELTEPLRIKMFGFLSMSWCRRLFFFQKATKDWTCLLWHMVYMLQLKINFRLKFFNLCLFSISFVS